MSRKSRKRRNQKLQQRTLHSVKDIVRRDLHHLPIAPLRLTGRSKKNSITQKVEFGSVNKRAEEQLLPKDKPIVSTVAKQPVENKIRQSNLSLREKPQMHCKQRPRPEFKSHGRGLSRRFIPWCKRS